MTFRAIPPSVERVLAAACRIRPAHGLYVTVAPSADGPAWAFNPFRRWLLLRTDDVDQLINAVACTLLARSAWLAKGMVDAVPAPTGRATAVVRLSRLVRAPPASAARETWRRLT